MALSPPRQFEEEERLGGIPSGGSPEPWVVAGTQPGRVFRC